MAKILSEQIPDYIIITNKTLKPEFQRLANWKIQKGLPTIIKNIEEIKEEYIGADLQEKLHAYLQECWHKWGDGLFVLLGGDTDAIPSRMYEYDGLLYPSDAYYADLNSDWNANKNSIYLESNDGQKGETKCWLGRTPVEDAEEAAIFVDKVLTYEKNPTLLMEITY